MTNKLAVTSRGATLAVEVVERRVYMLRGQRVMLDFDLATLYRVETRVLVRAVRRHPERFPLDFMFPLTAKEAAAMRAQLVIAGGGKARQLYAFTEHGVAMLSSVLNSKRAIDVDLAIVRAFIRLRALLDRHSELPARPEGANKTQAPPTSVAMKDMRKLAKSVAAEFRRIETPRCGRTPIGCYLAPSA